MQGARLRVSVLAVLLLGLLLLPAAAPAAARSTAEIPGTNGGAGSRPRLGSLSRLESRGRGGARRVRMHGCRGAAVLPRPGGPEHRARPWPAAGGQPRAQARLALLEPRRPRRLGPYSADLLRGASPALRPDRLRSARRRREHAPQVFPLERAGPASVRGRLPDNPQAGAALHSPQHPRHRSVREERGADSRAHEHRQCRSRPRPAAPGAG